jgi:hypothetical protein
MENTLLRIGALAIAAFTAACAAQAPKPEGATRTAQATNYTINRSSFSTIQAITRGDCKPVGNAACFIEVRVLNKCADANSDLVPKPYFVYLQVHGARAFHWEIKDSPGWQFHATDGIKFYSDPGNQIISSQRLGDPAKWLMAHKGEINHYHLGYQITLVNGSQKCVLDPGVVTDW